MKKYIIVFTLLLLAGLGVNAAAQQELTVAEVQAAWANEPALTQDDIDKYMAVWPKAMDVAREGFVKEDFSPIFQSVGWNDIHGSYVAAKMNMALTLIDAPTLKDKLTAAMPASAMPTETELELVKQNYATIMEMQNRYIDNAIK